MTLQTVRTTLEAGNDDLIYNPGARSGTSSVITPMATLNPQSGIIDPTSSPIDQVISTPNTSSVTQMSDTTPTSQVGGSANVAASPTATTPTTSSTTGINWLLVLGVVAAIIGIIYIVKHKK